MAEMIALCSQGNQAVKIKSPVYLLQAKKVLVQTITATLELSVSIDKVDPFANVRTVRLNSILFVAQTDSRTTTTASFEPNLVGRDETSQFNIEANVVSITNYFQYTSLF